MHTKWLHVLPTWICSAFARYSLKTETRRVLTSSRRISESFFPFAYFGDNGCDPSASRVASLRGRAARRSVLHAIGACARISRSIERALLIDLHRAYSKIDSSWKLTPRATKWFQLLSPIDLDGVYRLWTKIPRLGISLRRKKRDLHDDLTKYQRDSIHLLAVPAFLVDS